MWETSYKGVRRAENPNRVQRATQVSNSKNSLPSLRLEGRRWRLQSPGAGSANIPLLAGTRAAEGAAQQGWGRGVGPQRVGLSGRN